MKPKFNEFSFSFLISLSSRSRFSFIVRGASMTLCDSSGQALEKRLIESHLILASSIMPLIEK